MGGASYWGFKLQRVKLEQILFYVGNPEVAGNKFWLELAQVWVSEGSSHGESTITTVYQNIQDSCKYWCCTIQLHDHEFEKGNLKITSVKETFLKIKLKWQKEFKKSISVSKL